MYVDEYAVALKRKLRQRKHACSTCASHLSSITRTEETLAGAISEKRKRMTQKLIIAVEKLGMDLDSDQRKAQHHLDKEHRS